MNTEIKPNGINRLSPNGEIEKISLAGQKLSCALGCFDGVHLGHRALLETAQKNVLGLIPSVWTFAQPVCKPFVENIQSRLSLCGQLGIQIALCEEFEDVKKMSPADFILHLHSDFGVRHFICGSDFRFGINRTGDTEILKKVALSLGDSVTVLPTLTLDSIGINCLREEKISSTALRKMISEGDVETASKVLGRRFGVTANVCDGKHIGRTMGMPTINQKFEKGRAVPKFGVYYSVAIYDGKEHFAVTNVGVRPTVNRDESDVTCETHILDTDAELYGKTVRVEFCKYARCEQKFDGMEQLKNAIAGDICAAKCFFGINSDK